MNLSGVAAYSLAFLGLLGFRVPVPILFQDSAFILTVASLKGCI